MVAERKIRLPRWTLDPNAIADPPIDMYRPRSNAGQHTWNIASFIDTALAHGGQPPLFTLTMQTNQFHCVLDAGYASVPEKDLPATQAGFSRAKVPTPSLVAAAPSLSANTLKWPSTPHHLVVLPSDPMNDMNDINDRVDVVNSQVEYWTRQIFLAKHQCPISFFVCGTTLHGEVLASV